MSAVRRIDRAKMSKLYHDFHVMEKKDWDIPVKKYPAFMKELLGEETFNKTKDWDKIAPFLKLLARVANTCTEEEFLIGLETGEIPPIKLSKEELAALKGGCGAETWSYVGMGADFANQGLNLFGQYRARQSQRPPMMGPQQGPPPSGPSRARPSAGPGDGGVGEDGIPNLLRRPK